MFYAHSLPNEPASEWQPLKEHLQAVSHLAQTFATAFDSADWGRLAGLWHDLGKYRPEFQSHISGDTTRVDHAIVGALLAMSKDPQAGLPLALAIAGHHGAGLANPVSSEVTPPTPLKERLQANANLLGGILPSIPETIKNLVLPPMPARLMGGGNLAGRSRDEKLRHLEFWIRFLFSTLIDADRLDSEEFGTPGARKAAMAGFSAIAELRERLDRHIDEKTGTASPTPVNQVRREVLEHCRRAAELPLGLFSLTVPTGGGKTLSAMSFALRHAQRHGLRRVIVVIPYTSIIEQNAKVYRKVLGSADVIEHHSNLDPDKETDRNRLASENWDAPIIVTTNVQFLESLFSGHPSACRKLHNVARSVIVLDEVQNLPPQFLATILDGLQELVSHYGCTVVLSTATQPALTRRESLPEGLAGVREIIPEPLSLGLALQRTEVNWPDLAAPPVEWPALAEELAGHKQVLTVVHRREDARELARLLPEEGRFHLSALMCPRHRLLVLARVKRALKAGRPCRLVSTQLIEAGVDIDFPVVYRSLGGLDSVVQAAGRCNREGKLDKGRVVVFRAPTTPPRGTPAKGLESTESMLRHYGGTLALHDPCIFEEFFRSLYFRQNLDAKSIQPERAQLNFANVGRKFKLIEDGFSRPVVVPCKYAEKHLAVLRGAVAGGQKPGRKVLRTLQQFQVSVYDADFERLLRVGAIEGVGETVNVLTQPFSHLYSAEFGLVIREPLLPEPESHIH
jgi:CRISPR-associated endonuclease/helicase Cas3